MSRKPLFHIDEEDLFLCPVMLAIKLHDGRVIFTTGRFEKGNIVIEKPDTVEGFPTFSAHTAYSLPEERIYRTEIDMVLRTEQVGWKEGEPTWDAPKQLTGEVAHAEESMDVKVRGGVVPVPPNRHLSQGPEG